MALAVAFKSDLLKRLREFFLEETVSEESALESKL